MSPARLPAVVILTLLALLAAGAGAVEVCVRDSDAGDHLSCDHKIVVEADVPSDSSGEEASGVANIAETPVENDNGTKETKYIRDPPVVTISKSGVNVGYDLVYLRNAGVHSSSVGATKVLQTNLLLELKANDRKYVYHRSPGKIPSVKVPPFEALSQVGTANVTTKNIGKLEASYSLTFNCSSGINLPEEQSFTMKPEEASIRLFNLYTSTDQAAEYQCTAILKASDSSALDRKECRFSTTATVLKTGTQTGPRDKQKKGGTMGFFETVKAFWHSLWDSVIVFFTDRTKCLSLFEFRCQYRVAMSIIFPAIVAMIAWRLHRKGYFYPMYNWWKDRFGHHRARLNHN